MKNKLSNASRLLLFIAAIGLVAVLFTPIWRIELDAPQYPEGLSLTIHANGLRGNVDIINGLNHYIGMKTLHNEDFIEFKLLPYCIVFFAAAFALVALINRRRWLNILFGLFVAFGTIAMIDFWKWEYNYGHNLNPNAAIIVPGMAYQPPLIGFKQLLNFGAYSIPDTGGWLFIVAGILSLACLLIEWRKYLAKKRGMLPVNYGILLLAVLSASSCNSSPQALVAGKDNCYLCKMTITDAKYGAEIFTKKGKVYKFDDVHCMLSFMQTKVIDDGQIKDIYVADFAGNHSLVKVAESFFLQSGEIHAPMTGNVIAFKDKDSMKNIAAQLKGVAISWEQLNK